ncbi:MAG: ATP-dependent DNA ligase [Pseudomonadales bacterium]
MQRFSALYQALDETTSTNAKVAAMAEYFRAALPEDAAWAVYFLSGRRLKRLVGGARLRRLLVDSVDYPEWLTLACYAEVGDLAETVALLVEPIAAADAAVAAPGLAELIESELLPLGRCDEAQQGERIANWWKRLAHRERFLFTKLLTGALRVGVSQLLVARALAAAFGLPRSLIQHRLMGDWEPTAAFFGELTGPDDGSVAISRPYPFFLASPLDRDLQELGPAAGWLAEWKWDGIRAQLIRRRGQTFLWSRGDELITGRFPEVAAQAERLPDGTVLDGELVAWRGGVLPFAELQRRLGRKRVGAKLLDAVPVKMLVYDCLEFGGRDIRDSAQAVRRASLEQVAVAAGFELSPLLAFDDWEALAAARAQARELGVEGLMLKRGDAVYETGRRRGGWWKWKIDPLSIDAVLIYAQAGHGRRASLFTDYTFAVPDERGELKPIAKAYSGLSDAEIRELDRWIRRNTLERFGPVRAVPAQQVFEIRFEGIAESPRHKSGLALRFPRIARWRRDVDAASVDSLADVRRLLALGARTIPLDD